MTSLAQIPHSGSSALICALRYQGSRAQADAKSDGGVILLAVLGRTGLRFYASPSFKEQIQKVDLPFLDELVKDLVERARVEPDLVFQQLCDLSMGPVVTDSVRRIEEGESEIEALYPGFEACPE